jgi:hypothetical protein
LQNAVGGQPLGLESLPIAKPKFWAGSERDDKPIGAGGDLRYLPA